jgi:hypothetical protein
MSNLSNLYISASYKGIINLADSTNDITNQTNTELQDGLGQWNWYLCFIRFTICRE